MTLPTLNPLTATLVDEESQKVYGTPAKIDYPLFPASKWMGHQFLRLISKEERPLLLSRILKYLILQRAYMDPEIPAMPVAGSYLTNPPDIDGLPVDPSTFFILFIIWKAVSGFTLFVCYLMFFREQKQAGIDRIVSLEMLDHMKFSDKWTIIAAVTTVLNMITDGYVLYCLRCSFTECVHVSSSNPDGNSVLSFQYYFVLNFAIILVFPLLYWTQLILPCYAIPIPCCEKESEEDAKGTSDGALIKDIKLHS